MCEHVSFDQNLIRRKFFRFAVPHERALHPGAIDAHQFRTDY